ncbi:glycosyltransferase [Olleya sp. ITB9]|uniref:glycosyltransferase family protein n=1 Tax=Olleya sp. ITB9 TaxID=1715648 RepID=UPI0006D19E1D|nr:glycosyltransferase [Olleya sp. ITB9]
MKILLVGEYSRLHNSLKEGLVALGHEVTIIASGDGFKNYDVDIDISSKLKNVRLFSFLNKMFTRFFRLNFIAIENAYRFKKQLPKLKNYDVVQLINEDALHINPKQQIRLLKQLKNQNKKLFLLCCGDDYITIKYYLQNTIKYSILTPYLEDKSLKGKYNYSLKYLSDSYKKLHDFIIKNSYGTIATDIDYHLPMQSHQHYLGLIPNPININIVNYHPINTKGKIVIFHGINKLSKIKKGNIYFEKALTIIKSKYPDKVTILSSENVPYKTYINTYNSAHIILDQVFGFDQGYNALEAMAKGKVVFTGAEKEWLDYYNIEANTIAINALPDVDYLVQKLEWLILNPNQIETISKNARAFVLKNHDYKTIAKQYVQTWKNA